MVGRTFVVLLVLAASIAIAADAPPDPDEQLLKKLGIGTSGPDLLTFFRKRTLSDEHRAHETIVR